MKFRPLPDQAYLAACFLYDQEMGVLTWRVRPRHHFVDDRSWKIWNTKHAGYSAGVKSDNRVLLSINNVRYKAHRIIWKLVTGQEPSYLLDHKNVLGIDNKLNNLRPADHSENRCNSAGRKNHCYPKGVSPFRGGFQAQIQIRGVRFHLGFYDAIDAAQAAYAKAAHRLHGEFANTGQK